MCRATLYQFCFMSTSIAVFGCDGKILISFVMIFLCQLQLQVRDGSISFISTLFHMNFHRMLWSCYLNSYPLCVMSISIAVFGCIDEIYISICFMSTSIARFAHVTCIHIHFVLCQLPLQFLDALMKYISILSHVNFHCTLCPC